ncbi:phage tail assembly chaperone [Sinorhizobium meliloti]|uniref:phage tail assembly chaperone n=1 Tax=Rhizobium meliloti TaxID=382 RepID=UPI002285BFEA|nr:phage tail assembly chaperone [Sinorhizobium meliloti]
MRCGVQYRSCSSLRWWRGKRRSRRRDGQLEQVEPSPWREWMRIALGGLGWRPVDFWAATLTEFFEAIHGRNEANGVDDGPNPPSKGEMDALLAKYG